MMNKKHTIYFIGGSPCSGKSTVAEKIADHFGLHYFKVDEFLDDYIQQGKLQGKPICTRIKAMSADETWMRDPAVQNEEELLCYEEIFEFIWNDLSKLDCDVITEGAAYLPDLMHAIGIDAKHYINITPTFDFQYSHYKERPWVPYILKDCRDKEQAFENWMQRDGLFADHVRNRAQLLGYHTLITDGSQDTLKTYQTVCELFGLTISE